MLDFACSKNKYTWNLKTSKLFFLIVVLNNKGSSKKNTAKLYGDALVYPQSLLID